MRGFLCLARALLVLVGMNDAASTVLVLTDLSAASYRLLGFAVRVAEPSRGQLVLVSTLGAGRSETLLREEGRRLEAQRQWCADRGVDCQAVLCEGSSWPDCALQTSLQMNVDLILLSFRTAFGDSHTADGEIRKLAVRAPCRVRVLRVAGLPMA